MVKRKKDFKKMEKVHGRWVNILEGLELHAGVFSPAEQKQIVDCIYKFQKKGRNGELRGMDHRFILRFFLQITSLDIDLQLIFLV